MVLVIAAVVLVVLLALALYLSIRADRGAEVPDEASAPLPVGAEAAIWSIVEAVPDPRNHLALTRDLTGEVRITGTPLDPAHRAAHPDELDPWSTSRGAGHEGDPSYGYVPLDRAS